MFMFMCSTKILMLVNNLLELLFQFEIQENHEWKFSNYKEECPDICSNPAYNLLSARFPRKVLDAGVQMCVAVQHVFIRNYWLMSIKPKCDKYQASETSKKQVSTLSAIYKELNI